MGKILSIREKVPQAATLPDGNYVGIWGGYIITVSYKNKIYELRTEEGVKGTGFSVIVIIKNGVATFEEVNN